jgi:hypothetical protein
MGRCRLRKALRIGPINPPAGPVRNIFQSQDYEIPPPSLDYEVGPRSVVLLCDGWAHRGFDVQDP